ncbi:MAG: MarR family winged helix-turn-helix transcriptional regulator [Microbacteriaceae bacterium]
MPNPSSTPPAAQQGQMSVHPATTRLRDILELTTQFELHVGRELSVNPTDLDAMEELIKDGPLSPTELARRLEISTAAVTTVVDRLTAVGHVTRVPNPADRRGVLVVPAPQSVAKAMSTLMPMILGIDRVLDGFTEEERMTITVYLDRVVSAYREHLPQREEI